MNLQEKRPSLSNSDESIDQYDMTDDELIERDDYELMNHLCKVRKLEYLTY
mgnify:CR=1 FL=1